MVPTGPRAVIATLSVAVSGVANTICVAKLPAGAKVKSVMGEPLRKIANSVISVV